MTAHFFIFLTLCATVYGQLIIKARATAIVSATSQPPEGVGYLVAMLMDVLVLSGLFAGLLSSCLWFFVVKKLPLGYAYPFLSLAFTLVPIGSALLLGEPLRTAQLIGGAVIVLGVALTTLA